MIKRIKLLFLLSAIAILSACSSQTMGDVTSGTWVYFFNKETIEKESVLIDYEDTEDIIDTFEGEYEFYDDGTVQITPTEGDYIYRGNYRTSEDSLIITYETQGVMQIRGDLYQLEFKADSIKSESVTGSIRVDQDSIWSGNEIYSGSFSMNKE
ncbi:hypothetical protein B795N_14950 [Marinilactibacillus psychrotolerans]|uniref:hypothetical protein n=1 Tax=Marinilactibacillus psychrotolerans TaxID=191770 RepID=UPI001C7DECC8|nr:hypothetical protein [Marinilactibacillus psychrotolerans]GEQ33613.1 hypothetical protein B795N_14950 [Marinilactibacillus psychrotolerans]